MADDVHKDDEDVQSVIESLDKGDGPGDLDALPDEDAEETQ